ncbi:MAG TPA: CopD family protein [Pararobbsia sp.]|nr:CopD family protein [Pararobbsia sp.]
MLKGIDSLVIAQMTFGAIADLSFAMALGATLLGFGERRRTATIRLALVVWLVVQLVALVLEASLMSNSSFMAAWRSVPLVIGATHFGRLWSIGVVSAVVALVLACTSERERASGPVGLALVIAFAVVAFAHAGMTHAADAGDFSIAECVHAIHLWTTAAWSGVVLCAAWPLRRAFRPWSSETMRYLQRLSLIAMLTFVLAIATGVANAWRGLGGSLAPMTTSLWGDLLLAKLVMVGLVVVIGAINRLAHLAHRHAIDRPTLQVFMRLLTCEAVLMILVLCAASILGHSIPAAVG